MTAIGITPQAIVTWNQFGSKRIQVVAFFAGMWHFLFARFEGFVKRAGDLSASSGLRLPWVGTVADPTYLCASGVLIPGGERPQVMSVYEGVKIR